MPRISKYNNQNTDRSNAIVDTIMGEASNFNLKMLEKFQEEYGISDSVLASLIGMDKSQLSKLKSEKLKMSMSHLVAFTLVIRLFKTNPL